MATPLSLDFMQTSPLHEVSDTLLSVSIGIVK